LKVKINLWHNLIFKISKKPLNKVLGVCMESLLGAICVILLIVVCALVFLLFRTRKEKPVTLADLKVIADNQEALYERLDELAIEPEVEVKGQIAPDVDKIRLEAEAKAKQEREAQAKALEEQARKLREENNIQTTPAPTVSKPLSIEPAVKNHIHRRIRKPGIGKKEAVVEKVN
jgi:hypothetical protein